MKTFSQTITKPQLLEEIEKHRKADQILQGTYGKENGKWRGCAVGCSIHSINLKLNKDYKTSDHSVYETELGIPEWLARVEDTIFEGLPVEKAVLWPERFTKAIPVGVTDIQLERVKWQFTSALMQENIERVKKLKISKELKQKVVEAIKLAQSLNENSTEEERSAAGSAAWSAGSAAGSAARSAAWSARSAAWSAGSAAGSAARSARSAAGSAAWSAGSAARSAAWSAGSAAKSAAESAAYERYADVLIGLLEDVKATTTVGEGKDG